MADLNDAGVFPISLAQHSPAIAPGAQALAGKLPCLLECWPRYRVTQLGRLLLRSPDTQSPDEDELRG